MKLFNLCWKNGAPTATEYFDVTAVSFFQQIEHIFKELYVSALVAGDGNALRIFLYGRFHYFLCRAIVAKVNDFCAFGLHDSSHNVDGGIVAVKKRGSRDYSYFVFQI